MRANVKNKKAFLAWLPALLVIVGSIVTAAGISLLPAATAATDNDTLNVTGSVGSSINVSDCGAAVSFDSSFTAGGAAQATTADCTVSMDTNAFNGAKLDVLNNNAAPFFCNNSHGTCGGNNEFSDVGYDANAGGSTATTLGAGEFGAALESTTANNLSGGWTADADADVQASDDSFYPVQPAASAQTIGCSNNTSTAGVDCVFEFGAQPKAAQNSDSGAGYQGTVNFLATSL
jgi:hypothetical protein